MSRGKVASLKYRRIARYKTDSVAARSRSLEALPLPRNDMERRLQQELVPPFSELCKRLGGWEAALDEIVAATKCLLARGTRQ
jgi:hypothetical protein